MITITSRPKTTSWPCAEPIRGAEAESVGRSAMNAAPMRTPQSDPRPATAAPMRILSERVTENSFGCAKPFVAEDEERAGDACERGRDAEGERLVDREGDPGRRGGELAVADCAEGSAGAAAQHEPREQEDDRGGRPRHLVQPCVRHALRRADAGAAAGELRELQRQLRDRDREGEGREREVDAREAQRRKAHEHAAAERDRERERQRRDEVRMVIVGHDRGRVAADRHERAVADRDLPGVSGEDVQAEDGDQVDARRWPRGRGGSR